MMKESGRGCGGMGNELEAFHTCGSMLKLSESHKMGPIPGMQPFTLNIQLVTSSIILFGIKNKQKTRVCNWNDD